MSEDFIPASDLLKALNKRAIHGEHLVVLRKSELMPLYKEDLKDLKCTCGVPGCEEPLYILPPCHPKKPTWARYFDGVITIECSVCRQIIGEYAIADREVEGYDTQ